MTSSFSSRRPPRRVIGRKSYAGAPAATSGSGVGDLLRDAREAKGLDIYRVERDTKIRVKYLNALEDGEFTELPGDVYTRGFLRNYASYLGLDPDQIEEEWREEAGGSRPSLKPMVVGPQPLLVPGRSVILQRSHLALVGVLVVVAVVGIYFGYQVTRFLSYPTIGVTTPNSLNIELPSGSTGYTLVGTATAGSTVEIEQDASPVKTVVADDTGHWTYLATLHAGSNQFNITARNLDTNHASKTTQVLIKVPEITPPPPAPTVVISTPTNGSSFKDGKVTITGTSSLVASISVAAIYLGPPPAAGATVPPPALPTAAGSPVPGSTVLAASPSPTGSVAPTGPPAPSPSAGASPTTVRPNTDGTFQVPLTLAAGSWQLTLTGTATKGGLTAPVSVTVSVPFRGLNVVIHVKGSASWLAYWKDGVAVDTGNFNDGWQTTVVATKSVCIRTAKPTVVFISVNGADERAISSFGGTRVYVDANGPKFVTTC